MVQDPAAGRRSQSAEALGAQESSRSPPHLQLQPTIPGGRCRGST